MSDSLTARTASLNLLAFGSDRLMTADGREEISPQEKKREVVLRREPCLDPGQRVERVVFQRAQNPYGCSNFEQLPRQVPCKVFESVRYLNAIQRFLQFDQKQRRIRFHRWAPS